jgi:hypothetical protein
MKHFGKIKSSIIKKVYDLYTSGDNHGIKEIIKLIKENNELKTLYLFYDEMENKTILDKSLAESYVDGIERILKDKVCNFKDLKLSFDVESQKNYTPIYESLDILSEDETLQNIENKIRAKNHLVEHLMLEKPPIVESSGSEFTPNQRLLCTILANNFNSQYMESLTEEESKYLREILSLTGTELNNQMLELKESSLLEINKLLNESDDTDFKLKLEQTKSEIESISTSRYNYFRLKELKNNLL